MARLTIAKLNFAPAANDIKLIESHPHKASTSNNKKSIFVYLTVHIMQQNALWNFRCAIYNDLCVVCGFPRLPKPKFYYSIKWFRTLTLAHSATLTPKTVI